MSEVQLQWKTAENEEVSYNGLEGGLSIALFAEKREDRISWGATLVRARGSSKELIMFLHPRVFTFDRGVENLETIEQAKREAEKWYFDNAIALADLVLRA